MQNDATLYRNAKGIVTVLLCHAGVAWQRAAHGPLGGAPMQPATLFDHTTRAFFTNRKGKASLHLVGLATPGLAIRDDSGAPALQHDCALACAQLGVQVIFSKLWVYADEKQASLAASFYTCSMSCELVNFADLMSICREACIAV